MSTHECPKDGCDAQLPRSTLACRRHWYSVPKDLRDAVNRTWRTFSTDPGGYLAAREAAVEAMNR